MSKRATTQTRPATPTTQGVAARFQGAVAKQHGEKVSAGNYVGRMQRAAVKAKTQGQRADPLRPSTLSAD